MSTILKYADHAGRLGRIMLLVRFTMGAIGRLERGLPNEEDYRQSKEKIVEGYQKMLDALVDPLAVEDEQIRTAVDTASIVAEPSRNLIYNLCLVMLVTQVEIFIEHVVDVILIKEPRRLKDLASEKSLTASELVDLGSYEDVI